MQRNEKRLHDSLIEQQPGLESESLSALETALKEELSKQHFDLMNVARIVERIEWGQYKQLSGCKSVEDYLLLDEPTNHLDIDAILWLEQRLAAVTNGFVMVTHDRAMLDSVCTTILEVADRQVYRHEGNYSTYLERKADRENERQSAEQRRVSIVRRELEWLKRGPKARTGKDKGRSARIAGMLDDAAERSAEMGALPVASRRLGRMVLEIEGIAKRYGDQPAISGFSYRFSRGERVGLIGPNGSGKTTLLDVIAGRTPPDRGYVRQGETTVFGYFDQTGHRVDGRTTVLDYIKSHAERIPVGESSVSAEQFLERFLFPWSMFAQPLDLLSGGEFRRLHLVRVLASAPNFLLLDEPTNDLDIETLRVLEQYLDEWTGCLLLVSHDRALLDRVTDSLLVFDGTGGIRSIVGNYDAYRRELESNTAGADTPASGAGRNGGVKHVDRKPRRGLSFREQQEYDGLPDRIDAVEGELEELETGFGRDTHDPAELKAATKRYQALREEVARMTGRWEELAERADG